MIEPAFFGKLAAFYEAHLGGQKSLLTAMFKSRYKTLSYDFLSNLSKYNVSEVLPPVNLKSAYLYCLGVYRGRGNFDPQALVNESDFRRSLLVLIELSYWELNHIEGITSTEFETQRSKIRELLS